MMIKSIEEVTIYETPDGGKTVFSRKSGEAVRRLEERLTDPAWIKEQEISNRWIKLKEAVFMADSDPTLNDAISKVEMLYALKKKER